MWEEEEKAREKQTPSLYGAKE
uniref:Uncharacterized protein n=1 Tax=Anguilla anguilla TaxID=7936 RepID=A0A0E9U0G3_ANGAN